MQFQAKISLVVLSIFFMRPAHLGEAYNFFGALLFVLSSFLASNSRSVHFAVRDTRLIPVYAMLFMWVYFFIDGMILGVTSPYIYYSIILALMVFTGSWMIVASKALAHATTKLFVRVVSVLGLSSLVTLILSLFIPIGSLQIGHIVVPTYGTGELFFPLSMGYGQKFYPWGTTYRFSAFWREVGISQAIFCWAFIVVLGSNLFKARSFFLVGIVGGIFATQSTLAYFNLGVVFVSYILFLRKTGVLQKIVTAALSFPVGVGLAYISIFNEDIGLASKINGESFYDRYYAMENGIAYLREFPWGFGLYGNGLGGSNSGINLIAQSAAIGIVGLFAIFIFWVSLIVFDKDPKWKFIALFPIFFTMLTSQPLLDSFGIYAIMLLPVRLIAKPRMP